MLYVPCLMSSETVSVSGPSVAQLCSVDLMVTVQRGSVLDVRGPE